MSNAILNELRKKNSKVGALKLPSLNEVESLISELRSYDLEKLTVLPLRTWIGGEGI